MRTEVGCGPYMKQRAAGEGTCDLLRENTVERLVQELAVVVPARIKLHGRQFPVQSQHAKCVRFETNLEYGWRER
jgi:hypothetical protein